MIMEKKKFVKQKMMQMKIISKSSITEYLTQKEDFLSTQKVMHISKREDSHNLIYLNAQRDFITQMKENLNLE